MTMLTTLRKFLAPPVFEDEDKTRVARLLNTILLALIALLPVIFAGGLAGGNFTTAVYVIVAVTWVVNVGLWFLVRRGWLALVSSALLVILVSAVTAAVYFGGTIRIPGIAFYVLAILIAGLTLGRRAATGVAVLSALIVLGLFLAETRSLLPAPSPTTIAQWITFTTICALTTVLLHLSSQSIEESLERARRNEHEVRALAESLEQRVADRTRDLALAAEVGQSLATVRNLDELLSNAVESIRARFDLYYTQIYLVDPTGRSLIMRAGTGAVGAELKRRGFHLPIATGSFVSINGMAAAEKRPVIVADTTADPTFRPNALLLETRSEMAIPLIVGDRVVAVLDMQSARPGALSGEVLPAFQTLAGQLAVAIENARLFEQAELARTELVAQARHLSRSGWEEYLNAIDRGEQIQYTHTSAAEAASALEDAATLSVPIAVSGEPIGALRLEGDPERAWTQEETDLVQTVARQVAQQVENLRLLAQAEQYRSEAENAVQRLTRQNWREYREDRAALQRGYVYADDQVVSAPDDAQPEPDVMQRALVVRDEPVGVIEVAGADALDETAATLLSSVADRLSVHIENLRLSEQTQAALAETEDQARRLARLNELGEELSRANTLEAILQTVATRAGEIIHSDRSSIILLTETGDQYQTMALSGEVDSAPAGTLYPLAGTSAGMAVKQRRPVIITDPDLNELPNMRRFVERGLRSFMNAPLISGGKVIGTLNVASAQPDAYRSRDENLLLQVASLLASTLENRRLFEQTQKRADREAIINTITQRIQGTTSVEAALQTAARELGQRLKVRRAVVEIGADSHGGR